MNPEGFFEKVYVINLRSRADRLDALYANLKKHGWPFKRPEVWEAVPSGDGTVPCPLTFTEGGGAFGCRQSHVGILQHCLMQGIKSVLVLEDDAYIRSDFAPHVERFLSLVPADWQGIMLGGQHHAPPTKLQDGLIKVNYAQRTHAYGARGDYLRGLYTQWANATVHIDWLMRGWQSAFRVYAPERWLMGQTRSRSDICGRTNAATLWNSVPSNEFGPVYLLSVQRDVMLQLRELGFHTGYSLNDEDLDVGLITVFQNETPAERESGLKRWLDVIQNECAQGEDLVAAVWHPDATMELLQKAAAQPLYEVTGKTLDEALASLPSGAQRRQRSTSPARKPILLLHGDRTVVTGLRRGGFHTGYWRDQISDMDNGLRAIFETDLDPATRSEKLKEWCRTLRSEADNLGGVVVAWHPLAKRESFEAIGEATIEIKANTPDEAMEAWQTAIQIGTPQTFKILD